MCFRHVDRVCVALGVSEDDLDGGKTWGFVDMLIYDDECEWLM